MTATGRVIGFTFYLVIALAALLMFVPDVFLQSFGMWAAFELLLRWWFGIEPNPLKTLIIGALLVTTVRLTRQALLLASGDKEHFIVDWGLDGAPARCGGLVDDPGVVPPTHTATCDIWNDPERIVDQRIDRVLEQTKHSSREIEDFLHVNWPDKRQRAGTNDPDATVV